MLPCVLRCWTLKAVLCPRYRGDAWHAVTLPLDLSCRHVVQRLVLVFTGAEDRIWILLVRGKHADLSP